MTSKVIIFGIDAGSLKLIKQWQHELPNFKQIIENGAFGELESTVPALTCPAWPCIFTGKNPGKLGMYDFLNLRFYTEDAFRVFNSTDYHSASLWKILNDYGKEVGLLNIPVTFPTHKIDSFMVSGVGTPQSERTNYTYPPTLKKTLDEIVGGYVITPSVMLTLCGKEREYLKLFEETLGKRVKAARYLMNNFTWDLFVCVFFILDTVQHYFWHHLDKNHPKHNKSSGYKDVIKDFYKRVDEAIGTLISEIPKDANILIVSDHGPGPAYGEFSINQWLEDSGFLKFRKVVHKERVDTALRRVRDFMLPRLAPRLVRFIARLTPPWLARKLYTLDEWKDRMMETISDIDWPRTRAYGLGMTGGIFINLKGREPNGIVKPGKEYETLRDEIIKQLSQVVDPQSGKPAGFIAFRREEIYHGEYAELAPDITVTSDKYSLVNTRGASQWGDSAITGAHSQYGLFMAYGPAIRKSGIELNNLKVYDIAPTVLHMFGLPIPADTDGRVLAEIFADDSEPANRLVVYEERSERKRLKERVSQLKISGKI